MPGQAHCPPQPRPQLPSQTDGSTAPMTPPARCEQRSHACGSQSGPAAARYVDAGNQQQQAGSAEQHQENGTDVSGNDIGESRYGRALTAIGSGILFFQLLGNPCDVA